MASQREQIEDWTLGQLADAIANENAYAASARAEFLRRDALNQDRAAVAQERAADAQEVAALAAKETATATQATATSTQSSAKYMRYSVYILAASSALTAFFWIWDHISPRCH
jgi:hypothetical protein